MADPLEQLSDSDLKALSKNDLESMSDAGLKIVAASGPSAPQAPPQPEAWGHWAIRQGLPLAGQIGGGLAAGAAATPETLGVGAIPAAMAGAAAGNVAGNEAASWLNHKIYGDEAPSYNSLNDLKRVGGEAAVGATAELGGQVAGKALGAVANSALVKPWLDDAGQLVINGFNRAGEYVGGKAEQLAVNATGATAAQARQFAPGAGRMLLDKGIVGFGDSQEAIAGKAADALDAQGTTIQNTINGLTKQGAAGSKTDLVAGIQAKIDELGTDPAQAQVVKQLEGIKADVAAGPDVPDLSQMETTKRGFQNMVNYANPEGNAAKVAAADVYKTAGETAAQNQSPEVAQKFMDAKRAYGQLAPVADAGERRVAQLNQAPFGGLGDFVGFGVGGVPGVIAKRVVAPRVASTMAATADSLSKILQATPEVFGKWAPALAKAATRGEMSLNAADYVLQQTDPGYRAKRQEINNQGNQ